MVDIKDISEMVVKYNKTKGESGWNDKYDLNKDNFIDILDVVRVSKKIS